VAINPLYFFWHEGMSLDTPIGSHAVAGEMTRYRSGLLDPARWRKLFVGGVDLKRLMAVMAKAGWAAAAQPLREVARLLHLPIRDDLAAELHRVVKQGSRVHFMISEGDPGEVLLRAQAGRIVDRLLNDGTVTVSHFDGADHVFTRYLARQALVQALNELFPANPAR
jgi:hypothetical protein